MLYNLSDNGQWDNLLAKLNSIHQRGAWVEVTEKTARTSAQNRYLHAIFGYFGAELGYSRDYVKECYFKRSANPDLFLVERTDKRGNVYQDTRSTSELTKEEMQTAIERFRHWSATQAGLYIPSAEDWQAVLYMEQIVEKNAEFL